jgi:hypothetical protein
MKIKESDLAKVFIDSFDGSGYEVFQEVETYIGIADIVLKHANFIWSVEVKTSLSMQVIAQAWENQRIYNFSSICVPSKKHSKGSMMAMDICRKYGIGVFKINIYAAYNEINETVKAKLNRNANTKHVRLVEHQKTFSEAGNSDGRRWTPFNQTKLELTQYVSKNPGCKLKDALTNIKHHYASLSSAQNSIRQWINCGIIDNIEINRGVLNLKT